MSERSKFLFRLRLTFGQCGSRTAQLLKLADRDLAVCCVACFILDGLCDMIMTVICFQMLNNRWWPLLDFGRKNTNNKLVLNSLKFSEV